MTQYEDVILTTTNLLIYVQKINVRIFTYKLVLSKKKANATLATKSK